MSTNLALVDPAALPTRPSRQDRQRPELVEVAPTRAQRRARPRIVGAAIAVAALGVLLLAQLGISMVLSQGAYTLDELGAEQTQLSRTQQSLSEDLRVLDSPQNLARNAQALGMIANTTPVYLDPKTGRVFGTPKPAAADEKTASTENQVPNALLDQVPLAARPGASDTGASTEGAGDAGAGATGASDAGASDTAAGQNAAKTDGASASSGASSTPDVESDPNQLQAPTTR